MGKLIAIGGLADLGGELAGDVGQATSGGDTGGGVVIDPPDLPPVNGPGDLGQLGQGLGNWFGGPGGVAEQGGAPPLAPPPAPEPPPVHAPPPPQVPAKPHHAILFGGLVVGGGLLLGGLAWAAMRKRRA